MKVKEKNKVKMKPNDEKDKKDFYRIFLSREVTDSINYVKKETRLEKIEKFFSSIRLFFLKLRKILW